MSINIDTDDIDKLGQNVPAKSISNNAQYQRIEKPRSTRSTDFEAVNNNEEAYDLDELALLVTLKNEPNTYKQASTSNNQEKWQLAMQDEIDEFESQNTWTLTTLAQNKQPLKG